MNDNFKIVALLFVLILGLSTVSAQETRSPVIEGFEDGNTDNWIETMGDITTTTDAIDGQYSGFINVSGGSGSIALLNPTNHNPDSYEFTLDSEDFSNGLTQIDFQGTETTHGSVGFQQTSEGTDLVLISDAEGTSTITFQGDGANIPPSARGTPVTVEFRNYRYGEPMYDPFIADVYVNGWEWLSNHAVSEVSTENSTFQGVNIGTSNNLTVDNLTYSTQQPSISIDDVSTEPENIYVGDRANITATVSGGTPTEVTYTSNTSSLETELFQVGSSNTYKTTLEGAEISETIGTEPLSVNATINATGEGSYDSSNLLYDIEPSRNLDNTEIYYSENISGSVLNQGDEFEDAVNIEFQSVEGTDFNSLNYDMTVTYTYENETYETTAYTDNVFDQTDEFTNNGTYINESYDVDLDGEDWLLSEQERSRIYDSNGVNFEATAYTDEYAPYDESNLFISDRISVSEDLTIATEQGLLGSIVSVLENIYNAISDLLGDILTELRNAISSVIEWLRNIIYTIIVGLGTLLFYMLWIPFVLLSAIASFLFNLAVGFGTYHTELDYVYENQTYDELSTLDEELGETDTAILEIFEGNVRLESGADKSEMISELNSGGATSNNPYLSSREQFNFRLTAYGEILQNLNVSQPGLDIGTNDEIRDRGVISLDSESITYYDESLEAQWNIDNPGMYKAVYTSRGLYTNNDTHITRYAPPVSGNVAPSENFEARNTFKYSNSSNDDYENFRIVNDPDYTGITIIEANEENHEINTHSFDYSLSSYDNQTIASSSMIEFYTSDNSSIELEKSSRNYTTVVYNDDGNTIGFSYANYNYSSGNWTHRMVDSGQFVEDEENTNRYVRNDDLGSVVGLGQGFISATGDIALEYPTYMNYERIEGGGIIKPLEPDYANNIIGDENIYTFYNSDGTYYVSEIYLTETTLEVARNIYSINTSRSAYGGEYSTIVSDGSTYITGSTFNVIDKLDISNQEISDSVNFQGDSRDLTVVDRSINSLGSPNYNPDTFDLTFTLVTPGDNALNDINGLPIGTIFVINILLAIIGMMVGLIPTPILEAMEGFFLFANAIIQYSLLVVETFATFAIWVATDGARYAQYAVYAYIGFTGIRYLDKVMKVSKGELSLGEAVGWMYDDLFTKYQRFEANAYRATDVLTSMSLIVTNMINTITDFVSMVISVIRGIINSIRG